MIENHATRGTRGVGFVTLLAALALSLPAQIVSSSITGQVTDATGGAVRGAVVRVTNNATQQLRETASDEAGLFTVPQIPPGSYTVMVSAPGFRQFSSSAVQVAVGQTLRIDARLTLGEVSETVEVTGAASLVQSETSSVGQVITGKSIVELPLNGRNFLQLAVISPGVAPAYNARSATITNQSGRSDLAVHVSGNRGDSNSFLIDGVETRSTWFNSPSVLLSVDAVQEFKIDRNLFSAEYGQGSGIVSLVSRSGGNAFHGTAYEFLRNDKFDAANFFDNYFGNRKAPFRQNQFGAAAGGAIVRNKLFFFANWESFRSRRSNTLSAQVPTQDQLAGDLTGLTSTKRDASGALAILDPLTNAPFPGNRIPTSRISAVTKRYAQYVPVANNLLGSRNFVTTRSTNRDDDQFGGRLDYQLNSKDSLFVRVTDYDSTLFRPGTGVLSGSVFPYSGRNLVAQHTHVFSSALLNVFKFGYNRSDVFNSWEHTDTSIANQLGLSINQVPEEYGLPSVSVTGGYYAGGGATINQGGTDHLYQFSDTLSLIHGKHNLKFGADIRLIRFDLRLGLSNNGAFTFDGRYSGNSIADLLLGYTSAMNAQIGLGQGRFRSKSLNFFVADDLKLTPNFTLNLGLRYEYDQPYTERDGREGYFDTSLGQFVVGIPREASPIKRDIPGIVFNPNLQPGIWYPDRNNFGPRIGFAYRLGQQTAIRGGYGIFYSKTQGNELQFKINAPPLIFAASLTGNIGAPNLSWDRDAFPDPASPNFPVGTLAPFSVDPRDRTPYLQQWNLSINREIGKSFLAEVAYVASRGSKLAERVNINQGVLPDPANPVPLTSRRRFPAFGDILSANWQENSSYQSLQTRLERRYSNGLTFLAAYTLGHAIDTASRGSGGSWHQNAYRLRDDRGNSDFDMRHRLVASGVYELPFGPGKPFANSSHPVLSRIAGGWSVNSIASFNTGNYFSVTVSGDRANVGGYPFQRANRTCDGNLPRDQRNLDRWFDTRCFTTTPLGTFGNSGRNIVAIPGLNNVDFSVLKATRISEQVNVQFRAEFFNVFNHTQLGQPDLGVDSAFIGQIRSARDARITQLGLKLIW